MHKPCALFGLQRFMIANVHQAHDYMLERVHIIVMEDDLLGLHIDHKGVHFRPMFLFPLHAHFLLLRAGEVNANIVAPPSLPPCCTMAPPRPGPPALPHRTWPVRPWHRGWECACR